MRWLFALLAAFAVAGCSIFGPGAAPSSAPSAQSLARGAVSVLEDAWLVAAQACVNTGNQSTIAKCETVLDPARNALVAAAGMVDAWGSVDAGKFGCALSEVVGAIHDGFAAAGVSEPTLVQDAVELAAPFASTCASDAGANG